MHTDYALPCDNKDTLKITTLWLYLGLTALLLAGVFAVLLVLSRTPGVQEIFPLINFFKVALVIHVDMSVLIWFLAFSGVFWSFSSIRRTHFFDYLAILLSACGMLLMVLPAFSINANPIMNNYVPILNHPIFISGLIIFLAGMVCLILRTLFSNIPPLQPSNGKTFVHIAIYITALSALTTLAAILGSYFDTPKSLGSEAYHEMVSWGAGHITQFTHTALMLIAWLLLASGSGVQIKLTPRWSLRLFIIVLLPLLVVPAIYFSYHVYAGDHRNAFTQLMRIGGLTAIPLGAVITYYTLRAPKAAFEHKHLRTALLWSIVLFATGGIVGFLIKGVNVIIPAHYHGCTVGVTLAFMGMTYYLLPKLGFAIPNIKWATRQPWLYGGGQLLHILGLAWSGGYGVKRKVAGAAQGLDQLPQILGMGMMGLGGLISITGGLVFLLIAFRSIHGRQTISQIEK